MQNLKTLNNFKISKKLIGTNTKIKFVNKTKNIEFEYDHDTVYDAMKTKLETLNCWNKYNSYTSSNSIPTLAKPFVTVCE